MTVHEWKSDEVTIRIDYALCEGHGDCAEVCPSSVYALAAGKAVPEKIADCIQCCACVEACPTQAIDHSACR